MVRGKNSTPALVADLLHLQNCYKNVSPPLHTPLRLSMVKDLNPPLFFLVVFYFALSGLIEIFAHNSVNFAPTHTTEDCLEKGNVTDLACTCGGYVPSAFSSPL